MIIQSGRIRWARYEVLLKESNRGKRKAVRSFEGKRKLEDLDVDTWVILELI
jgi:hypothetical protein